MVKDEIKNNKSNFAILIIALIVLIILAYIINIQNNNTNYHSNYYDNIGINIDLLNIIYFNVGQATWKVLNINSDNIIQTIHLLS